MGITMTPRQNYPRPPIVEAVIQFHFNEGVDASGTLEALEAKLGSLYKGGRETRQRVEVQASVSGESLSTNASSKPDITFLRSSDHLRLLGVSPTTLSSHVLAPYPGWERFLEQTEEAVEALPDKALSGGFSRLVIRYINRIVFPSSEGVRLPDYFKIVPAGPPAMPQTLTGFQFVMQSNDDEVYALISLGSASPESDGRPVVIFDTRLMMNASPERLLNEETWPGAVKSLHTRISHIFEQSITPRTQELFR